MAVKQPVTDDSVQVRQLSHYQFSWVAGEAGEPGTWTLQLVLDQGAWEEVLTIDADDADNLQDLLTNTGVVHYDISRRTLLFGVTPRRQLTHRGHDLPPTSAARTLQPRSITHPRSPSARAATRHRQTVRRSRLEHRTAWSANMSRAGARMSTRFEADGSPAPGGTPQVRDG